MDYKKIYESLMRKAKREERDGLRVKSEHTYFENHHIIPDFMFKNRKRTGPKGHLNGDPNDPNNLVLLTMREHLFAHV